MKKTIIYFVTTIVIIVIAVLAWLFIKQPSSSYISPKENSIVVLPFSIDSTDKEYEYLADGLSNEIIGNLAKVPELKVISKTTAIQFKDYNQSPIEIATEAGVNVIVEGSVLALGDSVCLQIKLVSPHPEDKQLWMNDYMVERNQILELYKTVSEEISQELNVILTPEEERLLDKSITAVEKNKESNLTPIEFGKELGVNYVLEGSVKARNDSVEIQVKLINIETGDQIWNKTFIDSKNELLEISNKIQREVTETIKH
jgi:TolB-like protein